MPQSLAARTSEGRGRQEANYYYYKFGNNHPHSLTFVEVLFSLTTLQICP